LVRCPSLEACANAAEEFFPSVGAKEKIRDFFSLASREGREKERMGLHRRTGTFEPTIAGGVQVQAYVPLPPPPDPPLLLTAEDQDLMERANRALGRLDGIAAMLPDPSLFIHMYVRKEAVLSSQIEGTQSSISDLLVHEDDAAPGVPAGDVEEVSNYVAAMKHGLERIAGGFPLCLRLLREIHEVLMRGMRGGDKAPGDFRRTQNWLGGRTPGEATFVPPPPHRLTECLSALEHFLQDQPARTPLLLKAALAHVQFETIHPFLDGNGRLGRLLITLLLCSEEALSEPILYLSLYFKQNRAEYYERLQRVREEGAWEEWIRFFLRGVRETAQGGVATAKRLLGAFDQHDAMVRERLGQRAGSALQVLQVMRRRPVSRVARWAQEAGLSSPTVRSSLAGMMELGLVVEISGRERSKVYAYGPYLEILQEGTEPLP